jgi:hypothetical protein
MVEKTNKIPVDYNIKYDDFKKDYFTIKNFKLSTLKNACKKHHLKVTGNKSILFERLCTLFSRINASIKIQSLIRMHFSIIFVNKRGPGLLNRKLCNNQTDFITLEPLDEIPFEQFFSFKDNNNFIYGFNMISLMQNMKKTRVFENPYNRNAFSKQIKLKIIKLNNCSYILSNEYRENNAFFVYNQKLKRSNTIRRMPLNNDIINNISSVDNYHPFFDRRLINMNEEMENQINLIQEIRNLEVSERIDRLFVEFDSLGNYTSDQWYRSLTHFQLIRLYRGLYDIWTIRGQISYQLKRSICPFHDPFDGIFPRRIYHDTINYEQLQKGCLIVMENMTYSGINLEYRKIGALHALTALTMVSVPARQIMPWLYESII